jgi:hypothetical protein
MNYKLIFAFLLFMRMRNYFFLILDNISLEYLAIGNENELIISFLF